jgi:protease I
MAQTLQGKKIAILVADGFERVELTEPRKALQQAGAEARVVSPTKGKVKGWGTIPNGATRFRSMHLSIRRTPSSTMRRAAGRSDEPGQASAEVYRARLHQSVLRCAEAGAVICHWPWTLIDADVVRCRRMTSYPSLQTDLKNAGAEWVDQEVVVDQGLVSSRKPADIPAFNRKMVEEFAEGRHQRSAVA